jgi:hypothetical protein
VLAANQIVGRTRINGTEAVGLTKRGIAQNGRQLNGWEHLMIVLADPFTILCRAEILGCRQSESVFRGFLQRQQSSMYDQLIDS